MEVVRNTPGIIRIVGCGGKPHPVPDHEIDALQRVAQLEREVDVFPYLNVGEQAKVIAGPLSGITGIVTQFRKRSRLIISVNLIMQSVSVEVDESELAVANNSNHLARRLARKSE